MGAWLAALLLQRHISVFTMGDTQWGQARRPLNTASSTEVCKKDTTVMSVHKSNDLQF